MANYNPFRYRGYHYDADTGFYYLRSRYYDPEIGRFINADFYVSTGQGFIGCNMFAYCRNNPASRIDIAGYADTDIEEEHDDEIEVVPKVPVVAGGGGGSTGGNGVVPKTSGIQLVSNSSGQKIVVVSNPRGEPTEKHHIVEQCQRVKSGFTREMIQAESNIAIIPQSLHRKISGFYSSLYQGTQGVRMRDYLAGQSFEAQSNFGLDMLIKFWEELFGGNSDK